MCPCALLITLRAVIDLGSNWRYRWYLCHWKLGVHDFDTVLQYSTIPVTRRLSRSQLTAPRMQLKIHQRRRVHYTHERLMERRTLAYLHGETQLTTETLGPDILPQKPEFEVTKSMNS